MKSVMVTNAGGRLGLAIVRALHAAPEPIHVVGVDTNPYQLQRAQADEQFIVPRADEPDYLPVLRHLIEQTGVDFLWPNHEAEILKIASSGASIEAATFLPPAPAISLSQDKMASYLRLREARVRVPRSLPISSPDDLAAAFDTLGKPLWLRATAGTGGKGSLQVTKRGKAEEWIDLHQGWGRFMACQYLGPDSAAWESVWKDGDLVLAQTCKRLYWEFSTLTFSGVTGITGTMEWIADPAIDDVASRAIRAVDPMPHGVFTVDVTFDDNGVPFVTEVNGGRFSAAGISHYLEDGFNVAYTVTQLALGERAVVRAPKLNPISRDVVLVHGMDLAPLVVRKSEVERVTSLLAGQREAVSVPAGAADTSPASASLRTRASRPRDW
jgi:carbamoyl-phosphate synthase large subunit